MWRKKLLEVVVPVVLGAVAACATSCEHTSVTASLSTASSSASAVPLATAGGSSSSTTSGQNYQICAKQQDLTSPWTYDALAKGSRAYTVAQYEALSGYGTTLPPLPSYISQESPQTEAAVIHAPGSSVTVPAYQLPESPVLQFFEGGAYGRISFQAVTGDEFIGGAAPGYGEPAFNDGGHALGISSANDSFDFSGDTSTLTSAVKPGATKITTHTALRGYTSDLTFADGSTYTIASSSGVSVTLATKVKRAEAAGGQVWASSQAPIASVASPANQGAVSVTLTSSAVPLLPNGSIAIGVNNYRVVAVSGNQAEYTVRVAGLDTAVREGTPVYYDGLAGDVTVEYLNISHDLHVTDGTIYAGSGWTIEHNDIHDSYGAPGQGVAISGADRSVIKYNCFAKMGTYAMNVSGTNIVFDYNEVYDTSYAKDPGCGCSGGGKWWGTLNADIVGNAFVDDGPGGSITVWLDNGNAGTLISDNYFYKTYAAAIADETGYNLSVTRNLFVDDGWGSGEGGCGSNCSGAVDLNSSGGAYVPGSRFENSVSVSDNQFINDWMGIDIWQSGARSCENSGEGNPNGTDAPYCSGGFPNTMMTTSYYFSHTGDTAVGGGTTTLAQPAVAGATSLLVQGAEAIDDQVGFSDPAMTTTGYRERVRLGAKPVSISAATAGFPASGQLRVATSNAWSDGGESYTGAILAYTGKTKSSFVGVTLVRGSGTITGLVQEVQPYRVTAEKCYANDCLLTIAPPLRNAEAAGATIMNSGTCQLYATSAALPSGPIAPDGVSYWDGCQWEARDIAVTGNTFVFQPSVIASSAPLVGGNTTSCSASHRNGCGTNFMAFQVAGESPFDVQTAANAMMSRTGLSDCPSWDAGCTSNPLSDINGPPAPPLAPAHNGERPYDDVWSHNSYSGPWGWTTYLYGTCSPLPSDPTTGRSMPASACTPDFAQWRSIWQQDAGSSYRPSLTTSRAYSAGTGSRFRYLPWVPSALVVRLPSCRLARRAARWKLDADCGTLEGIR